MKKLLMFLCCVCAFNVNVALGNYCPASGKFELQKNQNGNDNELVYTNRSVYEQVVSCGQGVCDISKGKVYECDKENRGCPTGTWLYADEGWIQGTHNGGKSVGNKLLYCNSVVGDYWKSLEVRVCPKDLEDRRPGNVWNEIPNVMNAKGKKCYMLYDSFNRVCCIDNGSGNGGNQGGGDQGGGDQGGASQGGGDQGGGATVPSKKSCTDVNGKSVEHGKKGAAKCSQEQKNAGAKTCQGTCNDGVWNKVTILTCDKTKYQEKPVNGKCVPKDDGNQGGGDQGGGNQDGGDQGGANQGGGDQGGANQGGGDQGGVAQPVVRCDCSSLNDSWRAQYASCKVFLDAFDALALYCVSPSCTQEVYASKFADLLQLRRECEENSNANDSASQVISAAVKSLDDSIATLKLDVWKNAEGEFNVARLASDSIAGVVLGTAGGLITSHLVKKGQVKNGFEDIQCTIGGQKVADWGDEFTVGIR